MLSQIRVKNYKCLQNVTVDLEPFTVLIGPNDSGKTSFLTCLETVGAVARATHPEASSQFHHFLRQNAWRYQHDLPVSLSATAVFAEPLTYTFESRQTGVWESLETKGSTVTTESAKDSHFEPFENFVVDHNENLPLLSRFTTAPGELMSIGLLTLQLFKMGLIVSPKYRLSPEEMRQVAVAEASPSLSPRGENLASVIDAVMRGPDRQARNELEDRLTAAISTLQSLSTPVSDHPTQRSLCFSLSGDKRPPIVVPAAEVSDGAMLFTAFSSLVDSRTSNVILIEEPENGLHPRALRHVVEMLRGITDGSLGTQKRQVIITTHSPILLNFVEPREVRIFRRDIELGTSVSRMDEIPDIERLSKEFAVGELWYLFGEENLVGGGK